VRNIPAVVPYAERQTLAKIQQYALRIVRCKKKSVKQFDGNVKLFDTFCFSDSAHR